MFSQLAKFWQASFSWWGKSFKGFLGYLESECPAGSSWSLVVLIHRQGEPPIPTTPSPPPPRQETQSSKHPTLTQEAPPLGYKLFPVLEHHWACDWHSYWKVKLVFYLFRDVLSFPAYSDSSYILSAFGYTMSFHMFLPRLVLMLQGPRVEYYHHLIHGFEFHAHHILRVTKNISSAIPPSLSTQVYCKSGKRVGRGELCQLLLLLARPNQFHPKCGQTTRISVIWKLVKLATYGHYLGFSKSESRGLGAECVEPRNVSCTKIIKQSYYLLKFEKNGSNKQ